MLKLKAHRLMRDESGSTAIEYALIAALVGVSIVMALFTFEGKLPAAFGHVGNAVANAI